MKILFLSESTASTGGTRQLLLLASALSARGHRLTVACRPASVLNSLCPPLGIGTVNFDFRSDADVASALKLAAHCRKERYDVLQTFHPRAHGAALAAKYLGAPGALSVRRGVIFPIPRNPFSRFKYNSARISALIAVSEAVRTEFLKAGVEPSRIAVIPPGIEQSEWKEAAEARSALPWAPPFRIGMIAHFAPFKGQDLMLQAAGTVLKSYANTRFVFIGRGQEELRSLAAAAGLSGSVEILGPRGDVPALIRSLHIVAAPSRQEGVPNTLIEAQTAGAAVIGARVGGIPEVITDGETGLLFPPGDADALAQALLRLLGDGRLAGKLSAAGKSSSEKRFSMPAIAARFEELYRRASGAPR